MKRDVKVSGLDNLRPMDDDSEGNVYLAKRTREIDTIIKVLPYAVDLRDKEDPFTLNYLKEGKKLKALNHAPNIHVVKIHQVGLTENDHYPYVESELIKGSNLENLLTFPNNPIFRVKEVVDLALQLADALAHCHTATVKHGCLNINNIRLNSETGQYVLINFGRNILTGKQRMNEVETAHSVEFLAPEQEMGELLFETDVYNLGLVLFQALTGSVPQNLPSTLAKSPEVSVGSSISIPKQIEKCRADNLPVNWSDIEKEQEMNIPAWLIELISVSLDPEKRYKNGILFKEAILNSRANTLGLNKSESEVIKKIDNNASILTVPVIQDDTEKELEIKRLKSLIIQKDGQLDVLRYQTADYNPDSKKLSISKPVFFILLALLALLGVLTVYSYFFRKADTSGRITTYTDEGSSAEDTSKNSYKADMYSDSSKGIDTAALLRSMPPLPEEQPATRKTISDTLESIEKPTGMESTSPATAPVKPKVRKRAPARRSASKTESAENDFSEKIYEPPVNRTPRYTLAVDKAYFYDEPDVRTRRPVYMVNSNESEFTATNDSSGFIYVVFFNTDKQITRGWLRKQDLRKIN